MTITDLDSVRVRAFSPLHKWLFNQSSMDFFRHVSEQAQLTFTDNDCTYVYEFYMDVVEAGMMGGEL